MERLTHAAAIIKAAAEEINATLSKDESTINTFVQAQLAKVVSRLGFYTGIPSRNVAAPEFKPVTKFMGTAINPSKALTAADLKPAKTEVHQLATKVNKLYDMIQDFNPDVVLNSYANAANEVVLRGVAKKAGIQDYDTVDLNVPLIEQIIASKEAAAQKTADEDEIERQLAEQEKLFSENSKGEGDQEDFDLETLSLDQLKSFVDENNLDVAIEPEMTKEQLLSSIMETLLNGEDDGHDGDTEADKQGQITEKQIIASKEAAAQKTAPKKKGGSKK